MFFYYLIIYFAIDEIDPTKINFTRHIVSGLVIGLLFGLINGLLEVLIFNKRIKRLKFGYTVILKTIFFVLAFISTVILFILIKSSLLTPIGLFEVAKANEITEFFGSSVFYKHGLYAILFSFAINFLLQIDTKMGKKVLFNLFFGKFHNPTMQERVIMFLDLTSSTTIAEKIGDYKYSAFLKDFFYDLDEAINNNKGSVYQYVGDEVVVIWDLNSAVENNHCIKSYYEALASIKNNDYIKEYGIYPQFKAGIHFGPVVIT
ncbi:MAG: adenylate/guanylate cyclase domain-containing protein, partial [Ignavibacteriaceae bacterium]